ncbi:MAG: nucleotidyltransferase family protein [Prolixibacteraceae bacterium]|nr:nucleotidyltransferase family protein [Prolixibacteraceae bacterium]
MTNKELFYFAGKCLSLDEHPEFREEIIQRTLNDSIDWQKFVGLCSNHLILPAIYLKFTTHNLLRNIPEELNEFLTEVYYLNKKRNQQIQNQLEIIIRLLNENQIYPILLKGTGNLLDGVYCDIGERIIGDIDILVSEEDYLTSAKLLEEDGYYHNSPPFFDVNGMKHYPKLFKQGMPADVEIHRLPVNKEYLEQFNTPVIFEEKRSISKIPELSFFVLSDKHKVILNFIHTQLSNKGHQYGVVPLRDIYDLYLLSKRIDLKQTLPFIQYKSIAITYFHFVGVVLNLSDFRQFPENFKTRIFCRKHDLFLDSYKLYRINKNLTYILHRIYLYIQQITKSVYSQKDRKLLFMRMSNIEWYKNHITTYTNFFSGKGHG